jgi:RNA polymerase sigma factor (sigma-70 family)
MRNYSPSDPDLLNEWLKHQREPAFHELVARYAGLVHATARRTCGDEWMAAEISQLTFITLARKAKSLTSCPSLGGWLHRTALMQAKNLIRQNQRENRKRQHLAMENASQEHPGEAWREMQPVLDEALSSLSEVDREAILLRYYRSLTILEIAATLGIATAAAQKRLDRATERLRDKLARRGVQTGGSLSAALLFGLAADAQAATLSVSILASKAIAAGAAGNGVISTAALLVTTTAMKTTSVAVPLVVVIAAGAWIAGQRHSIAELRQESGLLREQLTTPFAVHTPVKKATQATNVVDQKPIDWAEVARQLSDSTLAARVKEQLAALDEEELDASLDEIAKAELSNQHRRLLQLSLGVLLLDKNPERGLSKFIDRVHEEDGFQWMLASHLGVWARKDPKAAVAWFDAHIAAGDFDGRDLKGSNYTRVRFEHSLTYALVASDPEAAGRRLAAFPKDQRIEILQGVGAGRSLRESDQLPFANLLREQLPDKQRLGVITWPVSALGEGGTVEYSELKEYLARIQARPDEREACILAVASRTFPRKAGSSFLTTSEDVVTFRSWVQSEVPELTARATGAAIGGLLDFNYPMAAGIALHLRDTGSGDEVLLPLLESHEAPENKELARSVAAKLSDAKRRAEYLEKFK